MFILRKKIGFCRHFHFFNIKYFFFIKYVSNEQSSATYANLAQGKEAGRVEIEKC